MYVTVENLRSRDLALIIHSLSSYIQKISFCLGTLDVSAQNVKQHSMHTHTKTPFCNRNVKNRIKTQFYKKDTHAHTKKERPPKSRHLIKLVIHLHFLLRSQKEIDQKHGK
mmetsp:Transcript_18024/g.24027  ORF Transcript_18024/g.24027 Transcript_18024/m.24027 type:complete len:111 (-) Transcript_18024:100-432(-)